MMWFLWLAISRYWAVGPGWYEPGLWPIIFAMPQSLSLVVIHVIFSTKDRRVLLDAKRRRSRNLACAA